jgi:hypothetical protein
MKYEILFSWMKIKNGNYTFNDYFYFEFQFIFDFFKFVNLLIDMNYFFKKIAITKQILIAL